MVRNEKQLLSWDDSVSDLREARMVQLSKTVNRIHICSSKIFNHEPVIVFSDNEVLPLSLVGKDVGKKSQKPNQRLLWCGTHKDSGGKIWISKILTNQASTKVVLEMQLLEKPLAEKPCVYSIISPSTEEKLLCWTLLNNNEISLYISLWSDGCVYKTEIPDVNSTELDEKKKSGLNCELVSRLSDVSFMLPKVPCVCLCHVASSFVCMAGTNIVGGESNQTEDILSLWDMRFGTLHSQKALHNFTKSSLGTPLTSGIGHLQCTTSFVIVARNTSVLACSYTAEKSTLSNSLGMLSDTRREGKCIKPVFLATPKLLKPSESVQSWTELVLKADEPEDEILARLLDPKKTTTAKQLALELQDYYENKCPKISEDELKQLSKRQKKRNAIKQAACVSQYFVTSIFERCVKEKELWSRETGNFLLKANTLPQSCLSQFLDFVLQNNDLKLLQECFRTLNGIPETSVVECLKYILRAADDGFVSCGRAEEWLQTGFPCSLSKAKCLCLILSYPINDVFMQACLRKLQFEDTLLFVKFLLHIIRCWSLSLRDLLKPEESKHKFSYAQILDWAALLLNAHFTQLIILPEAQTLLVDLHQVVAQQVNAYEDLEKLEGYLSHFKTHEPLPKKDCLGAYTIESMDL